MINKNQSRFFKLRKHLSRVELALLDSMIDLYGEKDAEKVAAMPEYKRFVLADLENDTRKAYEACQASKRSSK